jgi:hypothetical protein
MIADVLRTINRHGLIAFHLAILNPTVIALSESSSTSRLVSLKQLSLEMR